MHESGVPLTPPWPGRHTAAETAVELCATSLCTEYTSRQEQLAYIKVYTTPWVPPERVTPAPVQLSGEAEPEPVVVEPFTHG